MPEQLDLRERRRSATLKEIGDAALDLFERNGIDGTTVTDIAGAAGVSPRTFFRYFRTKEDAVLIVHSSMREAIADELARCPDDVPLFDQIEAIYERVLSEYDDGPARGQRMLRIGRLLMTEPSLRLAGLRLDAEQAQRLTDHIVAKMGTRVTPLEARLFAEMTGVLLRVSLDTWTAQIDAGEEPSLPEVYAQVRATARRVVSRN